MQETEWTKVLEHFAIPAVSLVLVEVHTVPISFAIQGPKAKQIIENITKQNYTIAGLTIKRLM